MARQMRESQLVVIMLTSIWLAIIFQYLVPMLLLIPVACIPYVGKTLYRHITGAYERWARLSVMAIPFSWCGLRVSFKDYRCFLRLKAGGNGLLLSSHCSRIDWLIGVFLSALHEGDGVVEGHTARVGFVAEATTALMPVIGWSRLLFGDIFITRAFHKDGPRIESNIETFHRSGIERLIFLAPEGFIADPGSEVGDKYIADCESFMTKAGQKPMTHLLTPRYKGMQYFIKHAPNNVGACAMAFVSGHPSIDAKSGVVVGGVNETKALRSPERSIPDLHSIFKGGLSVFVSMHALPFKPGLGGEEIRETLIADQVVKDADLRFFDEHRKYPGMADGDSWDHIAVPHLRFNAVLVAHTGLTLLSWWYGFGIPIATGITRIGYGIGFIMAMHGISHGLATLSTGGQSRESLVGAHASLGPAQDGCTVGAHVHLPSGRTTARAPMPRSRCDLDVPAPASAGETAVKAILSLTGTILKLVLSPFRRKRRPRHATESAADVSVAAMPASPVAATTPTPVTPSVSRGGHRRQPSGIMGEWIGAGSDPQRVERTMSERLSQSIVEGTEFIGTCAGGRTGSADACVAPRPPDRATAPGSATHRVPSARPPSLQRSSLMRWAWAWSRRGPRVVATSSSQGRLPPRSVRRRRRRGWDLPQARARPTSRLSTRSGREGLVRRRRMWWVEGRVEPHSMTYVAVGYNVAVCHMVRWPGRCEHRVSLPGV